MARTVTDEQRLGIAAAIFDRVEGNSGDFGVANEDELAEYLGKADALLSALPELYFLEQSDVALIQEACTDYSERVEDYSDQFSPTEAEADGGANRAAVKRLKELGTLFTD